MRLKIALAVAITLLEGCNRDAWRDQWYAPPPQRPAVLADSRPGGQIIGMGDALADTYIVRDISDTVEGGLWRWTFERPELRFWLASTANLRLSVEFLCSEITLQKTGPVTISFFVNERRLGVASCARAGTFYFEKAVPPGWLDPAKPTLVAAQADKLWKSPGDGKKLGFILIKAGFI